MCVGQVSRHFVRGFSNYRRLCALPPPGSGCQTKCGNTDKLDSTDIDLSNRIHADQSSNQ